MPGPEADNATNPLCSVHTSNPPNIRAQLGISRLVSTYQAGKVILVRSDDGTLNTHFRAFQKAMGIAVHQQRPTIGGAKSVWSLRNMPLRRVR